MNKTVKTFLLAGAIGVVTMAIGAFAITIVNKNLSIKPYLFPLFITGALLYLVLEYSGAHKTFCLTYLKP